jgi:hypothetical protein
MRNVNLEKWRGKRDPVALNPESMAYRDQPAPARRCTGCIFDGQWSEVCKRASAAAVRAGMQDCDQGVIYVLVEKDPRQIDLVEVANG